MAEYGDIPPGFAIKQQQFSDLPQGFTVSQPKTQTEATMRRLGFMGPKFEPNLGDAALGVADVGISGARGLVHKLAGTAYGLAGAVNPNDTYLGAQGRYRDAVAQGETIVRDDRLRTPMGPVVADSLSTAMNAPTVGGMPNPLPLLSRGFEAIGNKFGPEAKDVAESGFTLATLRTPRGSTPKPPVTAESVLARNAGHDSVGAAAAATNVTEASPELRAAIVKSGGRGAINNEALARHMEADTLPVPIRLTEGEATQNPQILSLERNRRGMNGGQIAARMDESNKALGQNMQALRDQIGPEVFSTNAVEHGDTLIRAYRQMDARSEAAVNRAYHNLRQAAGGNVQVDAQSVLADASARLHQKLLFDHAPPEIMRTLSRLAESNSMTFENFESMRTNLARIARSSADGNVKAAAGEIRAALEALPLQQGAEHLKQIADSARDLSRRRFQAIEADPAYDAAINGTVPPDKFVQRFVLSAPREEVDRLVRTLGNDPTVRQTVSVAALDHLRDAAKLSPAYEGNFSTSGFSRALQGLDPKARIIFDPRTVETLGKLNNVARYTTFQPRGSFVNNSNTTVAAVASKAADIAEGVANVTAGGIPIGTFTRRGANYLRTQRDIENALKPGAGIVQPRNALKKP